MDWKEKYKPAVPKRYLLLLAGLLWFFAGVLLSVIGLSWIFPVKHQIVFWLMPLAMILGVIKGKFVLFKAANRAVKRIYGHPEKACFVSMFSWKTWILIGCMMFMGQILRSLPYPRDYLGLVYVLIGPALATSSIVYWKSFFNYSPAEIEKR